VLIYHIFQKKKASENFPFGLKIFLIPTSEERNGNFLFPFRPSDVGILYSFILPYYDRARIYFYELSADDLLGCFGKIAE